jgi:CRISPR system Cascade subunit CasC
MTPRNDIIDIHILQSVPPSSLNRNDTGSPKTAMYGGVRRARVSSQAWKRATRTFFNDNLDASNIAYRTRKLPRLLFDRTHAVLDQEGFVFDASTEVMLIQLVNETVGNILGLKPDKLDQLITQTKLEDLKYALFIPESAVSQAVDQIREAIKDAVPLDPAFLRKLMSSGHSLDVALFGRMVADTASLNVDAACQVAHAISTHQVSSEFDFYSTVDDLSGKDETGAAMMGNVEFNSATLYRFASISVSRLAENLGSFDAVPLGVRTFIDAFVKSLPSGRQTSFAAMTLPHLVFVSHRDDQPISLVGAFEKPITSKESDSFRDIGYVQPSAQALARFVDACEKLYDAKRVMSWSSYLPDLASAVESDLGPTIPLPKLLDEVENHLSQQVNL